LAIVRTLLLNAESLVCAAQKLAGATTNLLLSAITLRTSDAAYDVMQYSRMEKKRMNRFVLMMLSFSRLG
jgi:hypothetical protein